jgi:hypothetical protein
MYYLEENIRVLDNTVRTWLKKHVKWIKGTICYINGGDYVDANSGEVVKQLNAVVETYSKKSPYEFYSMYWNGRECTSCHKTTISDISFDEYSTCIIVLTVDSSRRMNLCSVRHSFRKIDSVIRMMTMA